jgi:predicted transcriptional regulator
MKILWDKHQASVSEIHQILSNTELAYTTIATMLRKMEVKGLVDHVVEGRSFLYRPLINENEVTQNMAEDVLNRVFEGSLADMVSHLLTRHEVSPGELERLEKLIQEKRKTK